MKDWKKHLNSPWLTLGAALTVIVVGYVFLVESGKVGAQGDYFCPVDAEVKEHE